MCVRDVVREALSNMDDSELKTIVFDAIGIREDVIEWILNNADDAVDEIYRDEKEYWSIVETDRRMEAAWRAGQL